MRTVTCAECGKVFDTDHPTKRFCSYDCTMRWHSRNTNQKRKDAKNLEAVCPTCGATFAQVRKGHTYCSPKCKEKARLDRHVRRNPMIKVCHECGAEFVTLNARRTKCQSCSDKRGHGTRRVDPLLRRWIWEQQKEKCWLCGEHVEIEDAHAHHLDGRGHIDEPDNGEGNLVVLHSRCHTMFHRPHLVRRNGKWGIDGKVFGYLGVTNLEVFYEER